MDGLLHQKHLNVDITRKVYMGWWYRLWVSRAVQPIGLMASWQKRLQMLFMALGDISDIQECGKKRWEVH